MEKIHSEIAQKVLQKPVFVLPSSLVVSRVMYMLRHLQNRILKLETFAAPNWIPVLCLVSSHPPEQPPFHLSHAMGLIFHIKGLSKMKKERKKNILKIFWSPEGFISSQFLSKEIDSTNIHIFHLAYHDPLKITSWDVHLLQVSGMTDIKSDNTLLAPPKHSWVFPAPVIHYNHWHACKLWRARATGSP